MFYRLIFNSLVILSLYKFCESSYTSVRKSGSNYNNSETIITYKPKIFKLDDGLLPKVDNNTMYVNPMNISESTKNERFDTTKLTNLTTNEPAISTGRAIYYNQPSDIMSNLRRIPELYYKEKEQNKKIYPVYKSADNPQVILPVRAPERVMAMDRFTPGEAVATQLFKNSQKNKPPNKKNPIFQASQTQNTYVPPKNIYNFPPNLQSNYPPNPRPYPSSQVSSYIPPPAGPINSETESDTPPPPPSSSSSDNHYLGPLSPEYLPYDSKSNNDTTDAKGMPDSDSMPPDDNDMPNMPDMPDMPPDMPPDMSDGDPMNDDDKSMMKPPSGHDYGNPNQYLPPHGHEKPDHYLPPSGHDHEKPHDYLPPSGHDHGKPDDYVPPFFDYHHFEGHHPKYNSGPWNDFSSYPDFSHDHDHHGHDHDYDHYHFHHPEPQTTTAAPPPPPPEVPAPEEPHPEGRVKKYSYFYLGRKLWYIPLYFTVWFSFYVLWLIVKSIARHKVNLPNHYVAKRDVFTTFEEEKYKHINDLTNFVMKSIDKYTK